MRYFRRATWAAVAVVLALGGVAYWAGGADATTLTCTHTAGATTDPIGCGGIQSAFTARGILDMAVLGTGSASGNYFNSPVGVRLDSQSNTREDFTVFAVGGLHTGGPGNLGMYVAMYTPDGKIPGFTAQPAPGTTFTANSQDYCLSVVQKPNGPHGALRWNAVLRNCNTNGTFTMGNDSTIENAVTFGRANAYQVWAPVTGANGLLLVNESLSHGFRNGNTQYVLDIKGSGGDGSALLAFPENDALNEEWSVIGCTHPADELGTGYQFCP